MKRSISILFTILMILAVSGCAGEPATKADVNPDALASALPSPGKEPEPTPEEPDMEFEATPIPTPSPSPTPDPTPEIAVETMEEQAGYIIGSKVNLRAGPDTGFERVDSLKRSTTITILGKSGDWYHIRYGDTEGFVSSEFIGFGAVPTPEPTPRPFTVEKMSSKTAFVSASSANFRKGPGTDFSVIAECERYDKVTVTGLSDNWYRVKRDGKTGYIMQKYVKIGISPNTVESAGKFNAADVLLAAQIAYLESDRGDSKGYQAVASVILNRVKSSKYPSTVERVVFQGNGSQFSPADDEERLRLTKPSSTCVKAVREVFANGSILPAEVMYFRIAKKGTDWASSRTYYETFGGNCYFF